MRKILLGILLTLAMAIPAFAVETCSQIVNTRPQGELPTCIALDAVTVDTTSATIYTGGHRDLGAQIQGNGGGVTVNIECRARTNMNWFPCYPAVSNPTSTGAYVTLPRSNMYQIRTSGTAGGTTTVVFERYNN